MRSTFALLLIVWFGSAATAFAEVHLTMRDGRVTLKASNATVAEILAEWAKVGQTQIVNGEMVTGELVSIELTDVPEEQALEVILRSVAGYIAALRPVEMANWSRFDRILILPASTPRGVAASTTPSVLPEYPQYPALAPDAHDDSPDVATPNPRGTIDSTYTAYPQYPALAPDADDDSQHLATPNPRGTKDSTYPAYPQSLPARGLPPPPSIRDNNAPAGLRTPGQMPTGASVPGMPVHPAPQNAPAYPPKPIQNPQE